MMHAIFFAVALSVACGAAQAQGTFFTCNNGEATAFGTTSVQHLKDFPNPCKSADAAQVQNPGTPGYGHPAFNAPPATDTTVGTSVPSVTITINAGTTLNGPMEYGIVDGRAALTLLPGVSLSGPLRIEIENGLITIGKGE